MFTRVDVSPQTMQDAARGALTVTRSRKTDPLPLRRAAPNVYEFEICSRHRRRAGEPLDEPDAMAPPRR